MSPARRTSSGAAKRAMLAGAAIAILWPAAAQAQVQGQDRAQNRPQNLATTPAPNRARAPAAATPSDGLAEGELYMEADQVVRDDTKKRTTAEGSVEIRYENRTLRADRLVYDESDQAGQGVIRAFGHVQIINADGTVETADEFTLDEDMRAGVALGFSARLQENVKIAAASAVRRSEDVQELNRVIYTPCEICREDGSNKVPTWSISADRVVQDKKKRVVYYRNARIHVKGVTVLYLPVFWHADPQSGRASGFLRPVITSSDRRGLSYEQPYLQVIDPSSDLTISPQINTKVNPFLNTEYRKLFYSGDLDVRLGYTNERDFDGKGHRIAGSDRTSRSYILSRGGFRIDDKWRWGFTAERASDKLIFDKYEVDNVYEARGPYVADDRRLISQVYAMRQDQRSYFSAAAITVQGLRPSLLNPTIIENDRTFPVIAPLVEAHYEPITTVAGGRLRFHASTVTLTRDQSPTDLSQRLPGVDSSRVTTELDWRRSFTAPTGLRVEPFVQARADAYRLRDVSAGAGTQTRSDSLARGVAVGGADVSYPLFRRWRDATVVVEPLAQIAVSPDAKQVVIGRDAAGAPVYLNEDSVAFEFDETTLFRPDKFPGFDLYEDGARLNVAGRASVLWDDGRRGSFLLGRSFRSKRNDVFSPRSGLRGRASDWIVAADAQPVPGLSVFGRARLDSQSLSVHRLEAGANVTSKRGSGFVRYLTDDYNRDLTSLAAAPNLKRENLDLGGEVYATQHWGVSFYGNRDIAQKAWVIRDVGVFYRDDCVRVDVLYRREDTVIGRLGPSDQVSVRLTLATLGGPLYAR